jgi:hypothetical protein
VLTPASNQVILRTREQAVFGLKNLFGRSTKVSTASRRRRPGGSTVRLQLDQLDERLVPSTVAAAPNGTVYAIFGGDRELWAQDSGGHWSGNLMTNASQVSVGANGFIDVLKTDNMLMQFGNTTGYWMWTPIQHGSGAIGTIAAGQNGEVYVTYGANKSLWEHDARGWNYLNDQHLTDISVGGFGQIYKVYDNGSLHSADAANDAFSDNLLLSSGVHHVAGGTGWNYSITYGSSNQMWNWTQNYGWSAGEYNVAQIAAGQDGGHDYITSNGELVTSGWYQSDSWGAVTS